MWWPRDNLCLQEGVDFQTTLPDALVTIGYKSCAWMAGYHSDCFRLYAFDIMGMCIVGYWRKYHITYNVENIMPERKGVAGISTREMARKRRKSAIWIAMVAVGIVIILSVLLQNAKALQLGGGVILAMLVLMRVIPDLVDRPIKNKLKEEKRAIRGAVGEEKVASLLLDLGDDYLVLHDIVSPYGNIDHVVIGREAGVFLLETKSHWGKVELLPDDLRLNGKPFEKNFISQALKNAYWLRNEIDLAVGIKPRITSIIVFTNAFVPFGPSIKGVEVLNARFLINRLQKVVGRTPQVLWDRQQEIIDRLM